MILFHIWWPIRVVKRNVLHKRTTYHLFFAQTCGVSVLGQKPPDKKPSDKSHPTINPRYKIQKKKTEARFFFSIGGPQSERVSVNGIFCNNLFINPGGLIVGLLLSRWLLSGELFCRGLLTGYPRNYIKSIIFFLYNWLRSEIWLNLS